LAQQQWEDRVPIIVLTGFLGSGKTTLLNRLLRSSAAGKIAVVVNEFGEIGIDSVLIETWDGNTVLLDSGCVCCTVRESLATTLDQLYEKRLRGVIPKYERVVLETTGLADPGPILHLLATKPLTGGRYLIEAVATTVDAVNGWKTLSGHREAVKQVALADVLFLTKTDLVSEETADTLRSRLREINTTCSLFDANDNESVSRLLSSSFLIGADALASERWVGHMSEENQGGSGHRRPFLPNHQEHQHMDGIGTFSFQGGTPISWSQFSGFLAQLNALKGEDLLRVKGLVAVEGQPKPVVIHGVQQLIHSPALLSSWPDNRGTRIVFIVRDTIIDKAKAIVFSTFGAASASQSHNSFSSNQ
jgi:G3E family GTPase